MSVWSGVAWCFECNREVSLASWPALTQRSLAAYVARLTDSSRSTRSGMNAVALPNGGTVGLRNLGNTCYMNACLQALASCVPLSCYVLYDESCNSDSVIDNDECQPVTRAYRDVLRQLYGGGGGDGSRAVAVAPSRVLEQLVRLKPSFAGMSQQDSMEALRAIVDALHEESKYFEPKRRRLNNADADDGTSLLASPPVVPLSAVTRIAAMTASAASPTRQQQTRSMYTPSVLRLRFFWSSCEIDSVCLGLRPLLARRRAVRRRHGNSTVAPRRPVIWNRLRSADRRRVAARTTRRTKRANRRRAA